MGVAIQFINGIGQVISWQFTKLTPIIDECEVLLLAIDASSLENQYYRNVYVDNCACTSRNIKDTYNYSYYNYSATSATMHSVLL